MLIAFYQFRSRPQSTLTRRLFRALPLLVSVIIHTHRRRKMTVFPRLLLSTTSSQQRGVVQRVHHSGTSHFTQERSIAASLVHVISMDPKAFLLTRGTFVRRRNSHFPSNVTTSSVILLWLRFKQGSFACRRFIQGCF